MRTWQDFDYMGIVQFALFLFSGTFVPVATFPPVMQVIVRLTPLYHGVELVRGVALDRMAWDLSWHALYLVVVTVASLAFVARRMHRKFRV
jgi:lipooligosaccharide transport system permease protein